MHPTYGAPVKKTALTRLRQYNVVPPSLPLEITSAQAVSQPCYSNSSGRRANAQTMIMYRIVYNLVDIPAEHHLNRTSLRTRGHSLRFPVPHTRTSVQDIILPTSHTPLEPTTWKCGGSRHPGQLQGSSVYGNTHLNLELFFLSF